MPRNDMTSARLREARALELYAQGWSWPQISRELGYRDRSGAHRAAQRALKRRTAAAVEEYLGAQLVDLECLIEKYWPAAVGGDVRAAEVVLDAMEKRERLLRRATGECTCGRAGKESGVVVVSIDVAGDAEHSAEPLGDDTGDRGYFSF